MLRLQVVDEDTGHFLVFTDEPMRIEISLIPKVEEDGQTIIAHAYKGVEIDEEQRPDLVFDGGEVNEDYEV